VGVTSEGGCDRLGNGPAVCVEHIRDVSMEVL
jgi:hypothetical protein